ncbi:hypothetical protein KC321_g7 [Hortaea werneckii]|nr:hypothetical protein KC321_g7 [Hortaea werneckii]
MSKDSGRDRRFWCSVGCGGMCGVSSSIRLSGECERRVSWLVPRLSGDGDRCRADIGFSSFSFSGSPSASSLISMEFR